MWFRRTDRHFAALGFLLAVAVFPATLSAQSYTFTTLAGAGGGPGGDDGTGGAARFRFPRGVATDSTGNLYVADTVNHTIRKTTPAGVVSTLAGLATVTGTADGTGASARFNSPVGLAVDPSGNVYVADESSHTIRRIMPGGNVTTFAGTAGSAGATNGIGSAARFFDPRDVAIDGSGNLYVADTSNNAIRKITTAGLVSTFAGVASNLLSGSADGTGSAARFFAPSGVAVDGSGNVYVADHGNSTIRKITPAAEVTTFAGLAGFLGSADGTTTNARFNRPRDVATDGSGNVYVIDGLNNTIRKITPAGVVTTLAGSAGAAGSVDGTGGTARFDSPYGVAVDSSDNVYVADELNHAIRKISPAAVVTTLAGSAPVSGSIDATGVAARFFQPTAVTVGSGGNAYVADRANFTIRKISSAGVVSTFAGSPRDAGSANGTGSAARFFLPSGVVVGTGGTVYVADSGNHTIRSITPVGTVTTLVGEPGMFGTTDGNGSLARFHSPTGVAVDGAGNLYVADTDNHTIRMVSPAGAVSTLAGSAGQMGAADGVGAAARFSFPTGLTIDSSGNLHVADFGNHTIRQVTPARMVTTLAGLAGAAGSLDGTGTAARFNRPEGLTADSNGNLYVADAFNSTIRRITSGGVVTTVGGSAGFAGGSDGTRDAAAFNEPKGIAIDAAGNLYVVDSLNHNLRLGKPALADVATIDAPSGMVGASRQLDTAPQTATSWQWTFVRRPAASTAQLSSASVRNPTFSPDVADRFRFLLIASDGVRTSMTTTTLVATLTASGDANGDGGTSSADVIYLIRYLFAAGPQPVGSGDLNSDGMVNVSDIFYLINFLFSGGPPPP